jgi:RimJ/RimL family protein N-acetyltransferase
MNILETERLALRELAPGDEAFILELLGEPAFLKNIGDRGVRSLEDASGYIASSAIASYRKNGFGMYRVALKESDVAAGICGLVKREGLDGPDLGFAFLERFWNRGYASEAAAAILVHARHKLSLGRVLAITALENRGSMRVLEKLGFRFDGITKLPGHAAESRLFVREA